MDRSALLPRLQVLGVAVLFSTGGTFVKATALSGWQVAGFRSLVAAVTLWLAFGCERRGWSRKSLLVGLAYSGSLVGFTLASKLTTVANAVFLAGTAPLYIAILAPLLLSEPLRRDDLRYMAIMAVGMGLCLFDAEPRFVTAPDPVAGNLLAVVTGGFWALTVLGLRWLGREGDERHRQGAAIVAGNLIAFVVCLPLALPVSGVEVKDIAIVVYLGAIQIGLAYVMLTSALRRVGALEVSLLLLVEPVLAAFLAGFVHGEIPDAWSVSGGVLILVATLIKALGTPRDADPSNPARNRP